MNDSIATHKVILIVVKLLILCGALAQISLNAQTIRDKSDKENVVTLNNQVVKQQYCSNRSDWPELKLDLSVYFSNTSKQKVILEEMGVSNAVRIGKSPKALLAGRYEPGSKMPEIMDSSGESKAGKQYNQAVAPGEDVLVTESSVWIRLSTDDSTRSLGLSPGTHFLQMFAEVTVSDSSGRRSTHLVWSKPVKFIVAKRPEFQACE